MEPMATASSTTQIDPTSQFGPVFSHESMIIKPYHRLVNFYA